jgi:hypothetical protein
METIPAGWNSQESFGSDLEGCSRIVMWANVRMIKYKKNCIDKAISFSFS